MPTKGLYTQGIAVLFERPVSLQELEAALVGFEIVQRTADSSEWAFGGPTLVLSFRPEVNGYVAVDTVAREWPEEMGDPKNDFLVFGAWSMGHFGPMTFPGALARAASQSWHWPDGESVPGRHRAFVRVRASYVFGRGDGDALVLPEDYDPVPEIFATTRIARALLSIPGAICYFNPNGETLQTAESIDELFARYDATTLLPYEIWSNVRVLRLAEHEPWMIMDTVGIGQLDAPDHEALFAKDYDLGEVANFLRNAADYVVTNGPVIEDGDTMDGPGGIRWRGASFHDSLYHPPREVIRWLPVDGSSPPSALVQPHDREGPPVRK
jgi:hypothetical protein